MSYLEPGRSDWNRLRHLALLYRDPGKPWNAEDLVPWVAHLDAAGKPDSWLFDSLLFLSPGARDGRHFCADVNRGTSMSGEGDFFAWCSPTPARRADWEDLLAHYLRAVLALDAAIEAAAQAIGSPPPQRRNVVLMIPYPHVTQGAWGELAGRDVDFTVAKQNLDTASRQRLAAVQWYVEELAKRLAAAPLRHVHFLGVYWMYESLRYSWDVDDHWVLKELKAWLSPRGLKLLWIPFWSRFNVCALGEHRELYFDGAFLQPNFMFYREGKTVDRAARAAKAHGAGIEMEYYLQLDEPIAVGADRHARFREYLDGGVTYGYMRKSACAWFLGMDTFPSMRTHAVAAERGFYEDIARFVQGSYVPSFPRSPHRGDGRTVVALDLGGTHLRCALVDARGNVTERTSSPTPRSPDAIVAAMRAAVEALRGRFPEHSWLGIGVSTGGRIDAASGVVLDATALLPGWKDVPLAALLRDATGLPVRVDNDGHCAALAEGRFGAARDASDFVSLVLGTGLGGGVVLGDRLLRGATNAAGELGHVSVDAAGPRCSCGNVGCAELWASGSGLARLAREAGVAQDGETLVEAARRGDARACELVRLAGSRLGSLVTSLLHAFNPEKVVLGGPVAEAGDLLLGPMADVVAKHAMGTARRAVTLVRSDLKDAGLLGAAALLLTE